MSYKKSTPRTATGTRQEQSAHQYTQLVAKIIPRPDLVPDYIVLAVLLHHPDLAAPYISRLHPGDWETDLHQVMARIALSHLRSYGRVDPYQLVNVLHDCGESLNMELAMLRRVSDLIHPESLMGDAVAILTGHRREVVA